MCRKKGKSTAKIWKVLPWQTKGFLVLMWNPDWILQSKSQNLMCYCLWFTCVDPQLRVLLRDLFIGQREPHAIKHTHPRFMTSRNSELTSRSSHETVVFRLWTLRGCEREGEINAKTFSKIFFKIFHLIGSHFFSIRMVLPFSTSSHMIMSEVWGV